MAEGRSNAAIAAKLFITEKAVSKHAAGIFANLGLAPSEDDNRRVARGPRLPQRLRATPARGCGERVGQLAHDGGRPRYAVA